MQNPKFSQKVHKLNDFITAAEYSLASRLFKLSFHPKIVTRDNGKYKLNTVGSLICWTKRQWRWIIDQTIKTEEQIFQL